ncbi:MAG: hypothetical protein ACI9G1_003216 [Pirellulaceae bacterium]|jgi:hypothetical protein
MQRNAEKKKERIRNIEGLDLFIFFGGIESFFNRGVFSTSDFGVLSRSQLSESIQRAASFQSANSILLPSPRSSAFKNNRADVPRNRPSGQRYPIQKQGRRHARFV